MRIWDSPQLNNRLFDLSNTDGWTTKGLSQLAYNSDGTHLAFANGRELVIWNTTKREPILEIEEQGLVMDVVFHPKRFEVLYVVHMSGSSTSSLFAMHNPVAYYARFEWAMNGF